MNGTDYRLELNRQLEKALDGANRRLATETTVPPDIAEDVFEIARLAAASSDDDYADVDPYLAIAFLRGAARALLALRESDEVKKRNLIRVALEEMRHAVRDVSEADSVSDSTSTRELVAWLDEVLEVSQADLADVLLTTPRQIQRWLSSAETVQPRGDDAWRIRTVAKLVNHLRHVMTAQGVLDWFEHPHPLLEGRTPQGLLREPTHEAALLFRLASSSRSHLAT